MPIKSKELKRGAGVLLAISSLPSPYGIGALGAAAYTFVDFLKNAKQSCWQVLPIGPTSYGDSPYQSFSAFAGNPYFIDLDLLCKENLLQKQEIEAFDWGEKKDDVDYAKIYASRFQVLRLAFERSCHMDTEDYRCFCTENSYWLEDYALYMALKFHFKGHEWQLWPRDIRFHESEAVERYTKELSDEMDFWKFCQLKFFEQWHALKRYANENGIQIIGDIPIYVAMDSADVWVHNALFQMDEERRPVQVAGVPPDMFSETGQLWGNPLYDWDVMERTGFAWWKERMAMSARIYDVIRIDHFIGIVRYYSIPANETTAMHGEWLKGPGYALIQAIDSVIGDSKVIAEDLGVVVPAVRRLLKRAGYPGMKIMQFAFDSGPSNENLPCHYLPNMVVYGGTHDNETLVGHCEGMKQRELRYVKQYLHVNRSADIPKAILRAGYESVANTVVFQAQDILFLPNSARMNFPSTLGCNWRWRLLSGQLDDNTTEMLAQLTEIYGRAPANKK